MLRVDNVIFAHPGGPDLRFDFTCDRGEALAVRGASGSGKSTLLDLVAGHLTPRAGRIGFDGADWTGMAVEARPVSHVFQDGNCFDHLSARRNVAIGLNGGRRPTASQMQAVEEALAAFGLSHRAEARADRLSGGERQRVALARALVRARPVLLLDEPFSALDEASRSAAIARMADHVARAKVACLLVTHDGDDAERMGARVVHLTGEGLIESGGSGV